MERLELAQIAADIAWRLAEAADRDAFRGIHHRFNAAGPDPRFAHTSTGFMIEVGGFGSEISDFLTPWGRWKIAGTRSPIHSEERIQELIAEFGGQLVPHDDPAHMSPCPSGPRGAMYNLYALTRFGDIELPPAAGTAGLATGWAAEYPHMLATYPGDYAPYWATRREWEALCARLNPSPHQRRAGALFRKCLANARA